MKNTSLEAYESVKPQLKGIKKDILNGLEKIQKGTFREIAKASYLRSEQVWKRLSELKKEGIVEEMGIKQDHISGRNVTVWSLKHEA